MLHIIDRFFIHFVSSAFFVAAFYYALRYWKRRNDKVRHWLTAHVEFIVAALLVAALFTLREPYDIYMGNNSFIKSCFDQLSWFLGAAVSAWGLYRFKKG